MTSRGTALPRLVQLRQGAQPQRARPPLTPHTHTPLANKQPTRRACLETKTCLSRQRRAVTGATSSRLRNPLLDQPGLLSVWCGRRVRHNNVHGSHTTDDHDVPKQLSRLARRPLLRGGAPYRKRRLFSRSLVLALRSCLLARRRGGEKRPLRESPLATRGGGTPCTRRPAASAGVCVRQLHVPSACGGALCRSHARTHLTLLVLTSSLSAVLLPA